MSTPLLREGVDGQGSKAPEAAVRVHTSRLGSLGTSTRARGETRDADSWRAHKGERRAFSNSPRLNAQINALVSNRTSSAKYTVWNFLPKNIFEQFRRLANVYFLLIGLIQATTNLSPTGRWNTLGPLLVVIWVNMVREVAEDLARHAQDRKDNARRTHVRSDSGELVPTPWARVRVGDIVAVAEGEEFPADCLLLAAETGGDASAESAYCYVETANLDGESTLKLRSAALVADDSVAAAAAASDSGRPAVRTVRTGELSALRLRAEYEAPSSALYSFSGALVPCDEQGEPLPGVARQPLSMQNMLLRGTTLRNTALAHGLVVYTGADLRSVRNSLATPSKRSNVEERIDRSVLLIFVCLLVLCGMSYVLAYMHGVLSYGQWYVDGEEVGPPPLTLLVSFLILYNNLVPISLYVSVEAIKLAMSTFVEADINMYCAEHDAPASSRTSNLHEDLGQVKYVFTDKTGTLTTNEMAFARCSIEGVVYGSAHDSFDERGGEAIDELGPLESPPSRSPLTHSGLGGGGPGVLEKRASGEGGKGEGARLLALPTAMLEVPRMSRLSSTGSWNSRHAFDMTERQPAEYEGEAEPSGENSGPFVAAGRFEPAKLCLDYVQGGARARRIDEFMLVASTCHSMLPGKTEGAEQILAEQQQQHRKRRSSMHSTGSLSGQEASEAFGADLTFKTASPDEGALLAGAAKAGWVCVERGLNSVSVRVHGELRTFEVLANNDFTPSRKRMSVLLREDMRANEAREAKEGGEGGHLSGVPLRSPHGARYRYLVAAKGADDAMLELVCVGGEEEAPGTPNAVPEAPFAGLGGRALILRSPSQAVRAQSSLENTLEHLSAFATAGLRTLVLAVKYMDEQAALKWLRAHAAAQAAGEAREEELERVAAMLEVDMRLVGVSAIEDRLQPGVPEAIGALRAAGISVWMLTGDKMETAINIATAARLLSKHNPLLILNAPEQLADVGPKSASGANRSSDSAPCSPARLPRAGAVGHASGKGGSKKPARAPAAARISARISELERTLSGLRWRRSEVALVIDSRSLGLICEDARMSATLVRMSLACSAVVVCRVSPLLKAQAIRLIKTHVSPTPLTLAIGDGANDVSMIQEADVGVGIVGVEGTQARRASDYSIAQFRFLARLLLVHGRYNYRRVCLTFVYSFYKNVTMVLTLCAFAPDSAFSASSLYDGWLMASFNVFFTFLPVIAHGLFERDISPPLLLAFPQLHAAGIRGEELNSSVVLLWLLTAIAHALVVYFMGGAMLGGLADDPLALDGHVRGTCINGLLVVTISLKLALHTSHWTFFNALFALGSALLWFGFISSYSMGGELGLAEFADVGTRALALPPFWLALLLVPTTALGLDFALAAAYALFAPTPQQILMELDRCGAHVDLPPRADAAVGVERLRSADSTGARQRGKRISLASRSGLTTAANSPMRPVRQPSHPARVDSVPASTRLLSHGAHPLSSTLSPSSFDLPHALPAGHSLNAPDSLTDAFESLSALAALGAPGDELAADPVLQHALAASSAAAARATVDDLDAEQLVKRREQAAFEHSIDAILAEQTRTLPALCKVESVAAARETTLFTRWARLCTATRAAGRWARALVRGDGTADLLLSGEPRPRPLWLIFEDPDHERAYMAAFNMRNQRQALFITLAIMAVLLIHFAVALAGLLHGEVGPDAAGASGLILSGERSAHFTLLTTACTALAFGCYLVALRSRHACTRRHFEAANIGMFGLAGYGCLFVVRDARSLVMLVFPVFMHVVVPARWCFLWPVTLLHHPLFLALEYADAGSVDPLLSFFWALTFFSTNVVSRSVAQGERRDFALQQRVQTSKAHNQAILDDMLPRHVNAQMRSGKKVICTLEPSVSVIFCDIQDFKAIVKEHSPSELLQLLDSIYSAMDQVCEETDETVTKMETVGYTYMACAGLGGTRTSALGHAYDAVVMALDLLRVAEAFTTRGGRRIVARLGVNSGEALAGVVGYNKPQFCLFGDTINTAARMQSTGERHKLQISSSTYALLAADAQAAAPFVFEQREVMAKGKGLMVTYLVSYKPHIDPAKQRLPSARKLALRGGAGEEEEDEEGSFGDQPVGRHGTSLGELTAPLAYLATRVVHWTEGGDKGAHAHAPVERNSARRSPGSSGGPGGRGMGEAGPDGSLGEGGEQLPRSVRRFGRARAGFTQLQSHPTNELTPACAFGAADASAPYKPPRGNVRLQRAATYVLSESALREEEEIDAHLHVWDLTFTQGSEGLERIFTRAHDMTALGESARTLALFATGQVGYIVMEGVIFLEREPKRRNSAYVAMASSLVLLAACAATTMLGPVESALRMTDAELARIRRIRGAVVFAYAAYGALIPVAQVAKSDSFGSSSSALLIFSAALLASGGGVRFFEVLRIFAAWFSVWMLCGLTLGGFQMRDAGLPEHAAGRLLRELLVTAEAAVLRAAAGRLLLDDAAADDARSLSPDRQPGLHTLIVSIFCTLVASVYASYMSERSKRRLYYLLYRQHQEMARTDELLHDMMPPSVVAKLREKVQVADELQDVLLLYSDIKGFTDMASKCTPAEVISALQELYTQFDTLVLQYGLFKVQTIGDAYIIMSNEHTDLSEGGGQRGVKDSRRARHQKAQRDAAAMLKMAFAMVRALDTYNGPTPMQMRIGIHYGTVTAGIIGTKKARYDIFGPDTLLGNMIESTGVPGAVCVSERVLPLMRGLANYAVAPHVEVVLQDGDEVIGRVHSYVVHEVAQESAQLRNARASTAAATGSPLRPPGVLVTGSSKGSPLAPRDSMLRSLSSATMGKWQTARSLVTGARDSRGQAVVEIDSIELEALSPPVRHSVAEMSASSRAPQRDL